MNSHGQEFMGFRIIIGAIIAMFILMIIVGAINYFEGLKSDVSLQTLMDGFSSGINSPNGDVIIKRDVLLKQGTYTKDLFSNNLPIDRECFEFILPSYTEALKLNFEKTVLFIDQDIIENVYFQCVNQKHQKHPGNECEIYCFFSIGEDLGYYK